MTLTNASDSMGGRRLVPQFTIGDRLKKAREVSGYTQAQFGNVIGLTRGVIANLETETTPVKKPIVVAWAFATGVDIDWLLTGEDKNPTEPDGPDGGLLPDLDSNQEPADSLTRISVTYLSPKTRHSESDKKAA